VLKLPQQQQRLRSPRQQLPRIQAFTLAQSQFLFLSVAAANRVSTHDSDHSSTHHTIAWLFAMALRIDYLCFGILASIFITSIPTLAERTQQGEAGKPVSGEVAKFEGLRSCPYLDPVGVATIGYGTTRYPDGKSVTLTDSCIDKNKAKSLMQRDLANTEKAVERLVKVPLSSNQKAALTSFTFNVGPGALADSQLLARLNAGDKSGAAAEFDRWVHGANKEVLPGLVDRRAKEKAMFKNGQL
jgi:lysozyme